MAIFHLTANVISRARGQSAVAAAAYRSGGRLRDDRYGIVHDYSGKRRVSHSEIMTPAGSPAWASDRETLWNRVEAAERRRDSQLARTIEVGLPVELSVGACIALLRDYITQAFTAQGMIADFSVRRDNPDNPTAQILLTLRGVTAVGFGPKERRWNGKGNLLEWRSAWAGRANDHLARDGHAVRIDHRTLEAQQIELTPSRRVGFGQPGRPSANVPEHLTGRLLEQQRIAYDNGRVMLEDPTVALRALTHHSPTFTDAELIRFLRTRTDPTQFEAVYAAITACEDLVALEPLHGIARCTSRDMVEAGKSLLQRATAMATRRGHGVSGPSMEIALAQISLQPRLRALLDYLVGEGDAKVLVLEERHRMQLMAIACRAWEADGLQVIGMAAEPDRASVLVIEAAELIDLKQLERLLARADKARAKAVFSADATRLRALPAESPLHGLLARIGPSYASEIPT